MKIDNMYTLLKKDLKPGRYKHTLGVVDSALVLGKINGVQKKQVEVAALLHDCAKNLSDDRLLKIARKRHIPVDVIMLHEPQLLHGPVGAVIAREKYGVTDESILNAIRYHTTGRVGMDNLEKIIYLADYIEPGRNFPGIDKLRKTAAENLDKGVYMALSNTIEYVLKKNGFIHPLSVSARNDLLLKRKGNATGNRTKKQEK